MKRLSLLLILAWAWPAPAEDAKPPAPGTAAAAAAPKGIDERITSLSLARDPFWPPGFKPGGEVKPVTDEPTDDLDLLALREGKKLNNIGGRLKVGNKYLLMVKGRAVGQGDIIEVAGRNGKTFKMKIIAISQDNIQLEPVGQ